MSPDLTSVGISIRVHMHTYLLQLPAAQDADGPRTADCFVRLALAPKKDLIKVLVLRASPRHNVATAQRRHGTASPRHSVATAQRRHGTSRSKSMSIHTFLHSYTRVHSHVVTPAPRSLITKCRSLAMSRQMSVHMSVHMSVQMSVTCLHT